MSITIMGALLVGCHTTVSPAGAEGSNGDSATTSEAGSAAAERAEAGPPEAGLVEGDRDAGAGPDAAGPSPAREGGVDEGDASQPEHDASLAQTPDGSAGDSQICARADLVWKTAKKTNYESYPAPDSEECVKYHGCDYLGQFQACDHTMPESWVASHDIASVFPLQGLALHKLCLRAGTKTFVVTAIDTCADSDCGGCCTENRGNADRLIDLEKYTNQRFGVDDGDIEWADLGPTDPAFDGCN